MCNSRDCDRRISNNLSRESINNSDVTKYVIEVAKICKKNSLDFVIGGGISLEAISALKEINNSYLTRFETRKVIFSSDALKLQNLSEGMIEAVKFELLWLKNKKSYYDNISKEDDLRIEMLSKRWIDK